LTLLRYDKQGRLFDARDYKGNIVPIPADYLRDREEARVAEERRAKAGPLRLARRLARARARK
jgi:hypothetical protein